ncbi:ankyrin repeat-containing domain protein [Xylaria cubensis]|nr:ankyrin repeat-containing domain protein [Xylaria cubensis]
MATTIERRRQQNRLAQRRYRQRRRQTTTNTILQTSFNVTSSIFIPTPLSAEAARASEQSSPWSTYAPATIDSTKSFCELVADSANILLGGLGTINMDDVELPKSFVADRRTRSSGAPPTLDEVVDVVSKSRVYSRASSFGIDANKTDSFGTGGDADANTLRKGWVTPLHMAARKGRDNIVRTLLQHNADCNQRDGNGLTPLLHAVIGGCRETVTLLLSHGARVELVDRQSRSALHWAAAQKQEAVLRVLLQNGGDRPSAMNKCDDSGMTPLHIAVDSDFEAGVQLLLQFGASVSGQVR